MGIILSVVGVFSSELLSMFLDRKGARAKRLASDRTMMVPVPLRIMIK